MVQIIMELSILVFVNLSEIILASNSRTSELQADRFAYDIGYGEELIASLYLMQSISMNRKVKLSQRLRASHPHLAKRIGELERLGDG